MTCRVCNDTAIWYNGPDGSILCPEIGCTGRGLFEIRTTGNGVITFMRKKQVDQIQRGDLSRSLPKQAEEPVVILIHGPQASGKTRHAERFKQFYGCNRVIEADEPRFNDYKRGQPRLKEGTVEPGDLLLTNRKPSDLLDSRALSGIAPIRVIDIATALEEAFYGEDPATADVGTTAHNSDPVECRDGDWGFWDEVWSNWTGGFNSEAEARMALRDYCTDALDFHPARDAFRVSTIWVTPNGDTNIAYLARVSNSKAQPGDPGDKLVGFLLRNHHWSPFEMSSLCLEIRTQRDISAQILRHRSFSFQEFSTRYAAVEELLAVTECRFQDSKNRQSSLTLAEYLTDGRCHEDMTDEAGAEGTAAYFDAVVNETRVRSLEAYQELLRRGVAKEVARRILPIGLMPTKLYMTGTVRSWLHYCSERTKPGVQKEHRVIAIHALNELFKAYPMVTKAAIDAGFFQMSDEDRAYFESLEPFGVATDGSGTQVPHG